MKIGSLFSGYGGLDMGVQAVIGGEVAWHVEFDEAPSKILKHHWPDVPNYGDITAVDFSAVEPVDVITGGFPCQDLSLAGRRAGMRPGTRSGLWADFLRAIATIRPRLAVIENVRGLLSGCAESDLEPCPGCVGDGEHRPPLRALGRVLGDLAGIGYDARWLGVRAADAGAPHGRFRVFVVAYPSGNGRFEGWPESAWVEGRSYAPERGSDVDADSAGGGRHGRSPDSEWWSIERAPAPRSSRAVAADTGRASEREHPREPSSEEAGTGGSDRSRVDRGERFAIDWGPYRAAVERWERCIGRDAPAPAKPTGKNGSHRLSSEFVEWMMGLPRGHVTGIGLTRVQELKALGNGVVPQQAALAVSLLTSMPQYTTKENLK